MAGLSRNPPACWSAISKDRTSPSSAWSPAHAWRKNASRSPAGCCSTDCSKLSTCFQRSESIGRSAGEFAIKPGLRRAPVAHDRDGRDLEHFRRFFHAESAKEAHFDDLHFAKID